MQRTLSALRAAFLQLIEQKPLADITVRDIVAEADISYATFYRHFSTKDALLDAIATQEISRLFELSPPARDAAEARASCHALCAYVAENRSLWRVLLTGGAASAMREGFIRRGMQVGSGLPSGNRWLPADLGVVYGITATVEILSWWMRQSEDYPITHIVDFIDQLVIIPSFFRRATTAPRTYRVSLDGVVSVNDDSVIVHIGPAAGAEGA